MYMMMDYYSYEKGIQMINDLMYLGNILWLCFTCVMFFWTNFFHLYYLILLMNNLY